MTLTVLTLQKENALLKKKNLRLGELVMQRDAFILMLSKEKERLDGVQEQLSAMQVYVEDEINCRLKRKSC